MIWHLDLDSFFVSAERLRHPSLRGIAVAVGGLGPRGVLASCSYEARKLGIRSAMPTAKALKLCPHLIVRPPDFEYYSALSSSVFALLPSYTPLFESVSIDEAYLDMNGTESLFGPPLIAANKLRGHILSETGLTASIGIASNRLVAKIATDFCKPDNVHLVECGTEAAFLAPLSVARLPGCGPVTQQWLSDRGILSIGELQRYPSDVLAGRLGKFGTYLHDSAFGRGSTEFHREAKNRSISRETTFDEDISNRSTLEAVLWRMSSELGAALRAEGVAARAVRIKLRYPPFETTTRARTLARPSEADQEIFATAKSLFEEHWHPNSPLRLLGAGCVITKQDSQLNLFINNKIDILKDAVRARFGANSIRTGRDRNQP